MTTPTAPAAETTDWQPVAALLAWLIPGAGHVYLGEKARGMTVGVTIYALFLLGLLIGGIHVVDAQRSQLWFAGQLIIGPPAIAINYYRASLEPTYHSQALGGRPYQALPRPENRSESYSVSIGRTQEIGTLFTTLAGMLNLLVIIDVFLRTPEEQRHLTLGTTPAPGTGTGNTPTPGTPGITPEITPETDPAASRDAAGPAPEPRDDAEAGPLRTAGGEA